ncbi:ABC transporter permease [Sphingomonas abaci]|uniref:Transport permease protein n=1 Tax=Sphingomonas abaci TaxID=237611 RepID=A0A7W7EZC3_9SPHN|nr:ABC transporter permease [Sphingomonas abaci]MBB4619653.1 ABC-2 type transport system permease protein [Sphingomonas abaci]
MSGASGFRTRLVALTRKEVRQLLRDRSNLFVGLLLPLALILLFGYGLSFDVKDAPVAIVLEDRSPTAQEAIAGIGGSPYLVPVWPASMAEAVVLMRAKKVEAIVRVPVDFSQRRGAGDARIQLIVNGADATTASSIEGYVNGAIQTPSRHAADRSGGPSGGGVTLVQRTWFNEAGNSTWYLVPGLLVLVMTLIGAFLTSLLIAREWERGTLESLFVTPVRPIELVLSKLAPYLVIGAIDMSVCLISARFLFEVPIRGSLVVIIIASLLYLIVALLLGLFISGATRNQFAASQMALLASFMPAMMLSGFVFDLRNVPVVIQVISQLLPATHFMELVKSLFLAGTIWPMVLKDCAILTLYAVLLAFLTGRMLRKRLD